MTKRRDVIEPDGTLVREQRTDADYLEFREMAADLLQPAAVRRRNEARLAGIDWDLLEKARAFHVDGGQAYWDAQAPGAGLPTGAAAYGAATTFITSRRNAAWQRFIAALDRWRTA